MVDRDVVSGAVPQRSPDDRDAVLRKHVAAVLQMREVAQLERDVVHVGALALDEVHRVVVGIAAHEHEDVLDPVGHAEAEDALVEIRDRLHVRHHEGDVAELERRDAADRLVRRQELPVRDQLDGGALDVLEGERASTCPECRRCGSSLLMPCDGQPLGDLAEVRVRARPGTRAWRSAPLALDGCSTSCPTLHDEQRAILLARRDDEAGDLGVVLDLRLEIRRLEGRVRDAPDFDHRCILSRRSSAHGARSPSSSPRWRLR